MTNEIFNTERLMVRSLKITDEAAFYDMMSNPNVMRLVPREVMTKAESLNKLKTLIAIEKEGKTMVWALEKKSDAEFIGIGGLERNVPGEDEIAYRLREQFWGNGYGTEIATELVKYCFEQLNSSAVTAEVMKSNNRSCSILDHLLKIDSEIYNEKDECIDLHYRLKRSDWLIK